MVRLGNFLFHYRNALFPAAFLLLLWQVHPVFASPLAAAALGLAVAGLGQLLRAVTIGLAYIIRGGRHRQVYAEDLVTDGLFAHCRNPLYDGNLLILLGLGLAANSLLFLAVGMPFFLLAYRAIVAAEEHFLRNKFGAPYNDYCKRVPRFLPRLAGLRATLRSMEFNWSRLVAKEYGSAFAWMAGFLLVVGKNLRAAGRPWSDPALVSGAVALGALTVAYLLARWLKKSGRLKG
ncbi:MAG: hypothetical protein RJA22_450 [Verrucomicrobiota bacterium]